MASFATGVDIGTFGTSACTDDDAAYLWEGAIPIEPMTEDRIKKQAIAMKDKVAAHLAAQAGVDKVLVKDEEEQKMTQAQKAQAAINARREDDKYIAWLKTNKRSIVEENVRVNEKDEKLHEIVNFSRGVAVCPLNTHTHPPSVVPGIKVVHPTTMTQGSWTKFKKLMAHPKVAKTVVGQSDVFRVKFGEWRIAGITLERCVNSDIYKPKIATNLKMWQAIRIKQIASVDAAHKGRRMGTENDIYMNLMVQRFRKHSRAMAAEGEKLRRQWHIDNGVMTAEEYDREYARTAAATARKATKLEARKGRLAEVANARRESEVAWNEHRLAKAEAEAEGGAEGVGAGGPAHVAKPDVAPGEHALLPSGYGNPYAAGMCVECGGWGVGLIYREGLCKSCWRAALEADRKELVEEVEAADAGDATAAALAALDAFDPYLTDDEEVVETRIVNLDDTEIVPEHIQEASEFPKKLRTTVKWAVMSYLMDMTTEKHNPDCPEAAGREFLFRIYDVFAEESDAVAFMNRLQKYVTAFEICVEAMYVDLMPELTNWMEVETTHRNKHIQGFFDERKANEEQAEEYAKMYTSVGDEVPVLDVAHPERSAPEPEINLRIE